MTQQAHTDSTHQLNASEHLTYKMPEIPLTPVTEGTDELSIRAETEALRRDVGKLREDLAALTETLSEQGKGYFQKTKDRLTQRASDLKNKADNLRKRATEGSKDYIHDTKEKISHKASELKDQAVETSQKAKATVSKEVRKKPIKALAAAFGLGLVVMATVRKPSSVLKFTPFISGFMK